MGVVKKLADGEEYTLSKSKFCAGLQCHRYLWKMVHRADEIPPPDDATRFKFAQGNEVGSLARDMFPGGTFIKMMPWSTVVKRTRQALDDGDDVIYEAALLHDGVVVMVDVLKRLEDGRFDLIEVKASNSLKKQHIPDLAIQKYVLEGAGLEIAGTYLMHLNGDYTISSGLDPLVLEECTDDVEAFMPQVPENLEAQMEMLDSGDEPPMELGSRCTNPWNCALKDECWSSLPDISIINIPGLRSRWKLYDQGLIELDDLPDDAKLNDKQQRFMDSYRSGESIYDAEAIIKALDKLEGPIHFLDFETVGWALPKHDGMKPWRQLPFQWSLHVLDGEHKEFLWDSHDDPRPAFIESLIEALGEKGSIVVYSSFERSRLNDIAAEFPMYAGAIRKIVSRLWDQLDIFRDHYTDHRFGGPLHRSQVRRQQQYKKRTACLGSGTELQRIEGSRRRYGHGHLRQDAGLGRVQAREVEEGPPRIL